MDLAEQVRAAWVETLPSVAFDPDRPWRELGLNSLKALELALRLEQMLGRRVTFDGLTPDCTTRDWVRLLSQKPRPRAARPDPRTFMFFVTGMEGDDSTQAAFRHAVRREVGFETLDIGTIDAPGRELGDIRARAARLVRTVLEHQPDGDIRLAGFSFGALIAQEMACQLEARGRNVAFLALLDAFLAPTIWKPLEGTQPEAVLARLRAREKRKHRVTGWIGPVLRRTGAFELARRIVAAAPFRHRRWARPAKMRLLRASCYWALGRWHPGPCRAPTLLITSDDFAEFSSIEQWRAACPRLTVVPVPGRHFQLFYPDTMTVLVPAFLTALGRDRGPADHGTVAA